ARRVARELLKRWKVKETRRRGSGQHADVPPVRLGGADEPRNVTGWRSGAGDYVEDATRHVLTPARSASDRSDAGGWLRDLVSRFSIVLRAIGRQVTSRGASASASSSLASASSRMPHWLHPRATSTR